MKNLYSLLIIFGCCLGANAQILSIPDPNFKSALLAASVTNFTATNEAGNSIVIDINSDGEIQVSEALNVSALDITDANISSLTGVAGFSNLKELNCSGNPITSLDISGLTMIELLYCSNTQLTTLDVTDSPTLLFLEAQFNPMTSLNVAGLSNLIYLYCQDNLLTDIDLSGLTALSVLTCRNNQLTSLDISESPVAGFISTENNQLESMNLKNGSQAELVDFENNPPLQFICTDDFETDHLKTLVVFNGFGEVAVNSYCSFTPGGVFHLVEGNNRFDSNANGCDLLDMPIPYFIYRISDGTNTATIISDDTGGFSLPVSSGSHTITPEYENPGYFTASPAVLNLTFPGDPSPYPQDFCLAANGIHQDLEIVIIPTTVARPGFDADYKIVYKNKGTSAASGTVTLNFDDPHIDNISVDPLPSSSSEGMYLWNFTDLQPLEKREITMTFNLNSDMEIPPVTMGYQLNYDAEITPTAGDEYPQDNTFGLKQIVVASLDPNDIKCLEGDIVAASTVGEFVHYLIRFENTGTFAAENVVVKSAIDVSKFDVDSLVPVSSSHSFVTRINQDKIVEFIFEGIFLPFDDANNDGYIVYKIRTLPTLVEGDTFSSQAEIYFDFNYPVITNVATTTIQTLGINDNVTAAAIRLYPNPAEDILNIEAQDGLNIDAVTIYNAIGQLVFRSSNVSAIDVSGLSSGSYLLKIATDRGESLSRFIKR